MEDNETCQGAIGNVGVCNKRSEVHIKDISVGRQNTRRREREDNPTEELGSLYTTVAKKFNDLKQALRKDPPRNYILEFVMFIYQMIKSISSSFNGVNMVNRIVGTMMIIAILWIPLIIGFFTVVPSTVFFIIVFYIIFYNLSILKCHLDEVSMYVFSKSLKELATYPIQRMEVLLWCTLDMMGESRMEDLLERLGRYYRSFVSQTIMNIREYFGSNKTSNSNNHKNK